MALQGPQGPQIVTAPGAVDRGFGNNTGARAEGGPSSTAPGAGVTAPTGTGSVAAPAPLPHLAADPTYLEFVRSLGLSQGDAEAAAQQATARVGARLNNSLDQSQFSGAEADRRLAGGYEARGVANSGEALRGLAVQRTQQGYREEALRQAAAQQLEALTTQLAMQNQAGQVGLANTGLRLALPDYVNAAMSTPTGA